MILEALYIFQIWLVVLRFLSIRKKCAVRTMVIDVEYAHDCYQCKCMCVALAHVWPPWTLYQGDGNVPTNYLPHLPHLGQQWGMGGDFSRIGPTPWTGRDQCWQIPRWIEWLSSQQMTRTVVGMVSGQVHVTFVPPLGPYYGVIPPTTPYFCSRWGRWTTNRCISLLLLLMMDNE